ncbi:zinc finger protein-like 1 [Octopus sinensis]|uniref:Zinc finger protein-like 1 n=1 Tax=Octopus sinensis TaxID=2607531 RepID=A0A6P7S560_9MOLL|nr:zinc finger protein-like 1 [Octopus sinensis]
MGLCKCPKKKVTNLFCFEHRVNVCEHCLVANHPRCIVQSYLQWLQDSDYNPLCTLCNKGLAEDDSGDCVRLVCYDVFHWDCLNQYALKMPPNTAPAGYSCPTCKHGIFPASNLMSPVAESLRQVLKTVNWARAGLGLPLIKEESQSSSKHLSENVHSSSPLTIHSTSVNVPTVHSPTDAKKSSPQYTRPSAQVSPYTSTPTLASSSASTHSIINLDPGTTARGEKGLFNSPRKLFDSTKDDVFNMSHDHDEDKYRRRPALSWLARLFKTNDSYRSKDPNATMKKFLVVLVIGLIGFITVVMVFSHLGHMATQDDPAFNPLANPNIHVKDQQMPNEEIIQQKVKPFQ